MQPLITHKTDRSNYLTFKSTTEVPHYKWCGIENSGVKHLVNYDVLDRELSIRGEY